METNTDRWQAGCDALVERNNILCLLSAVGHQTTIKAMRACLEASNVTVGVLGTDMPRPTVNRTLTEPAGRTGYWPWKMCRSEQGYRVQVARLGYDAWHLLAIVDCEEFLPVFSRQGFLNALRSPRFTTPFLDCWADWLASEMASENNAAQQQMLFFPPAFQACSAMLTVTTEAFDAIVSAGLRSGAIAIPAADARVA